LAAINMVPETGSSAAPAIIITGRYAYRHTYSARSVKDSS